jgi:Polysaccharide deacetylase
VDSCEPIAALCEAERWPITIYLMTALLGGQARFWFGELSEVLSAAAGRRFALGDEIFDLTGPAFGSTKARLVKRLRSLPGRDAIELVDRIREAADVVCHVPGHRRFVDREFVSTYAASDWIAFGSHTVDHQALAVQSEQQVLRQLSESRTRLEEAVGRPVIHFCYPYGYPEWIGDAAPRLASRYYRSATTMVRGVCTSRSNPCYLPRVSLYECDSAARAFAKIFAAPWL